ncbi:MAG: hypothetical protein JO112_21715 [Planctomycetes bacterium]|nr:hypothetical protein [Planctomycetota bacterium]
MNSPSYRFGLFPHFLAAGLSFIFLFGIPVVGVLVMMYVDDDPGGPIFLPIFVMGWALFTCGACGTFLGAGIVLQNFQGRKSFPNWLPLALLFPFYAASGIALWRGQDWPAAFWVVLGGVLALAFSIYWLTFWKTTSVFNLADPVQRTGPERIG